MDTVISRMMRLLGAIVVLGFVASGIRSAQLDNWDGTTAYMIYGVISAGIFTAIHIVGTLALLGAFKNNKKRPNDSIKNVVGVSTGVLALFTCCGFVASGFFGVNATDNTHSLVLEVVGSLSTAALCAGWAFADWYWVSNS